ncbi:VOC family protein [Streptomyces sp. NPDC056405]|uniref:VOC family protein n=1 Tax=Streptomyces sp. NPDC056405 TaxID=3345811 RepID=UPI0035D6E357
MAENGASAKRTSGDPSEVPAYPEGVPCWVDAQLSDVAAGKRFYGELFGWTFDGPAEGPAVGSAEGPADAAGGESVWARLGGEPVAALVRKRDGRMPTVWSVYFHTPDAVALAERIRAGGGQIVTPPHPVGGLGTTALAADPDGAVFALWQPAGHPGFGRRHEPGTFTWTELYTRDTEAANTFYGDLFHDALFGPDADPDFGRAPVSSVFPAQMPPHFLVHFLVGDVEAALGAVARLGGRVRVPPFETSYGGVAVVSDDQGASFALLQR